MKRFVLGIAIACAMAIVPQLAVSQSGTSNDAQGLKHVLTTMPDGKGRIRIAATRIDKDWASSVVHLKGDVRVEIWTTTRYPGHATVLYADEVDYHENTGEISPRGNVRLMVEDAE
jgi:lipopolysaccharide assembly outer membrane protein LptD (OstA)